MSSSWDRRSLFEIRPRGLSQLAGGCFTHPPPLAAAAPPSPGTISPSLADIGRRLDFLRDFGHSDPSHSPSPPITSHFPSADLDAPSSLFSLSTLFTSTDGSGAPSPPPSLRVLGMYEKKNMETDNEQTYTGLDPPTPRVTIDNESYDSCTVVKVDDPCGGIYLVAMLDILKSLALELTKCYISSDGPYFLHVFHVVDSMGRKIGTPWTWYQMESRIRQAGANQQAQRALLDMSAADLELTAPFQPDLIPELVTLLNSLDCTILSINFRKYGARIAAILKITSPKRLSDPSFLAGVEAAVEGLILGAGARPIYWVRVRLCWDQMAMDRRLFWMAMDDVHFYPAEMDMGTPVGPSVHVMDCVDSSYTLITVEGEQEGCGSLRTVHSEIVDTITDLGYDINHAIATRQFHEYYVRHKEGIVGLAERDHLTRCLQFSLDWCPLQGTGLISVMRERPSFLVETMAAVKEQKLCLTGSSWYTDGTTTLAKIVVPKCEAEVERESKGEEEKPSCLRRVFGLGSSFLRGMSAALRYHTSLL